MALVKAIDRVTNIPDIPEQKITDINKLVLAMEYTVAYSPDRHGDSLFEDLRDEYEISFGMAVEVQKALDEQFLKTLYVDRVGRQEIQERLNIKRALFVHGLPGVGKTVVLRKIDELLAVSTKTRFLYIDLKSLDIRERKREFQRSYPKRNYDFESTIRSTLYKIVREKYISYDSDLLREWKHYQIKKIDSYDEFKEWLEKDVGPLPDGDKLEDILKKPRVQEMYDKYNVKPTLGSLLEFLRDRYMPVVLCLDNVDAFILEEQQIVADISIQISNRLRLPVLVAIREPNVKRLNDYGAKADIVVLSEIKQPRTNGGDQELAIHEGDDYPKELIDASIKQVLDNRYTFVREHSAFSPLTRHFISVKRKYGLKINVDEYAEQFWEVFDTISQTFVDNDVYKMSNYNIRQVLLLYYSFIHKLILLPEAAFSIEKLIPEERSAAVTLLRNYFYKWLICGDYPTPPTKSKILNILEPESDGTRNLCHKILSYLLNKNLATPERSITIGKLKDVFFLFAIDVDLLTQHISEIAENQYTNERAMIWVDAYSQDDIRDETTVFLMPAGEYFLNRLATSREYAFWFAITTPWTGGVERQIIGNRRQIDFDTTNNDAFKLQVVANLVQHVLIPDLLEEIAVYDDILHPPRGWSGSDFDYFKRTFAIRGEFYPTRLLRSVVATIEHTSLNDIQKVQYRNRYQNLIDKMLRIQKRGSL